GQMSSGTTELDRPVPLYMQVVRQLRAQIASGELREGDRLPSQRAMMARWHISMQTASKVIGAMKTEGLAVPSAGRDTLVAPGAAGPQAYIAEATASRAVRADEESAAAPAGDDIAVTLKVDPGSPVLLARTRHYAADGKLIEYAETTIRAGHWHTRAYTITGN